MRLKLCLTGVRFEPPHTLLYKKSRLGNFRSLARYTARTSCVLFGDSFAGKLFNFNLINFWIQRSNLLHSLRDPFQKIWRNGFVFKSTQLLVWGTLSAEDSSSSRLKLFSDRSAIWPHSRTHVPDFSTEENLEFVALDRSAVLPGCRRPFCFKVSTGKILNSEI